MSKLLILGLDNGVQLTAQYNPKELGIDKSVPWQKSPTSSGDQPELQFTSAAERADPPAPPPAPAEVRPAAEVAAAPAGAVGVPAPSRPLRVLVVGDSVAYNMADGLSAWSAVHGDQLVVWNRALPGCAFGRGGWKRYAAGEGDAGAECARWAERWPGEVERFLPDVVLTGTSPWDAIDRRVPALGDDWWHVGQASYDDWIQAEMTEAVRVLQATGVPVVWFTQPHIDRPLTAPENDPARMDRLNDLARQAVRDAGGATVAELGPWVDDDPTRRADHDLRVDGVHLGERGRLEVAAWLAPQLATAAGGSLAGTGS